MCAVVIRVKYRAAGETAQLLPFDSEEAADARISELIKLDTVASVKLFKPWRVVELQTEWVTKELG